jgi:sugar (pentulose or hexulose) kinase
VSLLGIDLGTTGVRAAAFSVQGELLVANSISIEVRRTGKLIEIDAESVFAAVLRAISRVATSPEVLKDQLVALSFSVQGEAVVPIDAQGRAITPVPVSMDRRGTSAAMAVGDELGAKAYQQISGQPLHPMFSIFKIAAGLPGWRSEAKRYQTLDAFIAARLGAAPVADYSMAARVGALDVRKLDWSEEILSAASAFAAFEIPPTRLPEIVAAGTVIGRLSALAAKETGLVSGMPIVAGLHDQAASFFGAGGRVGGRAVFSLGSSDCLAVGTPERPSGTVGTGFAAYPIARNAWITLAGTAAGGWSLDWFARLTGTPIAELFDAPAERPPRLLVLPYFAGSGALDNDPSASGVIAGLTLDTSRPELARALLESAGFELDKITAALARIGVGITDIRAVGTGARNLTALRIRASAAGRSLVPVCDQASARGAAFLAGIGVGLFADLNDLPDVATGEAANPDPRFTEWYAMQRETFSSFYTATAAVLRSLNEKRITTDEPH